MAKGSTRRMVTQSVTVIRDGKRVSPALNTAFDFTAEEVKYLDKNAPAASRKSVNEDADVETLEAPKGGDTGTDATAPGQKAKATAKRTPRRAANAAEKKAAEADAEDEDGDAGDDAGTGEDDDI